MQRIAFTVDTISLSMRIKSTLKIVVESNFHVYAFGPLSENTLHIQILSQFIEKRVCLGSSPSR